MRVKVVAFANVAGGGDDGGAGAGSDDVAFGAAAVRRCCGGGGRLAGDVGVGRTGGTLAAFVSGARTHVSEARRRQQRGANSATPTNSERLDNKRKTTKNFHPLTLRRAHTRQRCDAAAHEQNGCNTRCVACECARQTTRAAHEPDGGAPLMLPEFEFGVGVFSAERVS